MNSTFWVEFVLPVATLFVGWFSNAYRTKQRKEKDTLDNVQQIIDIQKGYIAEQQAEMRGMRANNRRISEIIEQKNKSIRKANKCKFTNEGDGCPVLIAEEKVDDACASCHLNPDNKEKE